ncbi:MAG: peptide ABC transporter substrate-binding protein [Verrucomicrobiota bacterium]
MWPANHLADEEKRRSSFHKRPFFRLLVLALASSFLCSCDQGSLDSSETKQILRRGNGSELQSLDPHVITGVPESRVVRALFEGLVALDPVTLEPIPAAAREWVVSADGTQYEFFLAPDRKWSNGDPVVADDFKDSIQRILTVELGAGYASQLFVLLNAKEYFEGEISDFDLVGVEAPDEHTLKITLKAPTPFFLSLLVNPAWFPVHRKSIETFGEWTSRNAEWAKPGNLVSNGPYRLAKWKLNDYLSVDRNPFYPVEENFPLDEIVFFPIPNIFTEERAFLDDLIDITSIVSPQRIQYYLESDSPEVLSVEPDLGVYYLLLNTLEPPLNDPRVREALSLTIDRTAISRDIRRRGERPARHFTPVGIGAYESPSVIEEDVIHAKALLAEAGYGPDNPLPPIEFLFNTSETHRPIAEAIQSFWKERLGITITLVNKEWKTYLADRTNRDFKIARAGWLGDYLDPDTFLGLWTTESTNNFSGWSNPEFDRLMAEAGKLPSGKKRYQLLADAEEILLEELPLIPIFFYNRAYLISPRVKNWPSNILGYTNYSGISMEGPQK